MKRLGIPIVLLVAILMLLWGPRILSPRKLVSEFSSGMPKSSNPGVNANTSTRTAPSNTSFKPAALSDADVLNLAKIKEAYSAPIAFFGRVLDQNGNPIPEAAVHYSIEDKYFKNGSKREGLSDAGGFFQIEGVSGAGIWVNVAKSGYDGTDRSGASFGYGVPSGNRPPSKEYPAIFVLRKKAVADPLIRLSGRQFEIPKNGEPRGIDLTNGKSRPGDEAQIEVESWVNDEVKGASQRFDWQCRLTVPGGGLMQRDQGNFEAPAEGFKPSDEFKFSKSDSNWSSSAEREYFLKLRDGNYARIHFQMMAGGHYNFFVIESYLNPSGSRNLEFDPSKEIKSH
jgi:hypothetical protein